MNALPQASDHLRDGDETAPKMGAIGQGAVQRELVSLAQAGILTRTPCGNQIQYRANKQHPVYQELRALVLKTVGLVDVLREALAPLSDEIAVAFVFGSMASGEPSEASDVDVMVIREATFGHVVAALSPTQDVLGREVNPSVYPCDEWVERLRTHHHFVTSVANGAKLYLTGDDDELGQVAEARP